MSKEKENDDAFRFRLILNEDEEEALREYLSKRKKFVVWYMRYIRGRESSFPHTHLY